jgi:hypothetical protein
MLQSDAYLRRGIWQYFVAIPLRPSDFWLVSISVCPKITRCWLPRKKLRRKIRRSCEIVRPYGKIFRPCASSVGRRRRCGAARAAKPPRCAAPLKAENATNAAVPESVGARGSQTPALLYRDVEQAGNQPHPLLTLRSGGRRVRSRRRPSCRLRPLSRICG